MKERHIRQDAEKGWLAHVIERQEKLLAKALDDCRGRCRADANDRAKPKRLEPAATGREATKTSLESRLEGNGSPELRLSRPTGAVIRISNWRKVPVLPPWERLKGRTLSEL